MWNNDSVLKLIQEMPNVLNDVNLERIQNLIDYDKYVGSVESDYDLCGTYANFCKYCDKIGNYPCAVAYVKMMQERGMDVEIEETTKKGKIRLAIARKKK